MKKGLVIIVVFGMFMLVVPGVLGDFTYAQINAAERGLVLYYSFDDFIPGEPLNDLSGLMNYGTCGGGINSGPAYCPLWVSDSWSNSPVVELDSGVPRFITASDDDSLDFNVKNEFTLMGWFHFEGDVGVNSARLIAKEDAQNPNWGSYRLVTLDDGVFPNDGISGADGYNGGLSITIRGGGGELKLNVDDVLTGKENQWVHIAATYDGSTLKLFVDGVDQGGTQDGPGINIQNSDQPLGIGANNFGANPHNGRMEEIRLYDRAVPESEIKDILKIATLPECTQFESCNPSLSDVGSPICGDVETGAVLILRYEDDPQDGDVLDSSGSAIPNHGQCDPDDNDNCYRVGWWPDQHGNPNSAIHVDASESYFIPEDERFNAPFISVSTWVKLDNPVSPMNWQHIITKRSCQGVGGTGCNQDLEKHLFQWSLQTDMNRDSYAFGVNIENEIHWIHSDQTPLVLSGINGGWVHLAGTYDGQFIRLYVNGEEQYVVKEKKGIIKANHGLGIVLGSRYDENPTQRIFDQHRFEGFLDETYFFDRALTIEEVNQLFADEDMLPENTYQMKTGKFCFDPSLISSVCMDIDVNAATELVNDCEFGCNMDSGSAECNPAPPGPEVSCGQFDGQGQSACEDASLNEEHLAAIQTVNKDFAIEYSLDFDFCTNPDFEGIVECSCEWDSGPTPDCFDRVEFISGINSGKKCVATNVEIVWNCDNDDEYQLTWDGSVGDPRTGSSGPGCEGGVKTFQCPSRVDVPFFSIINLFVAISLIIMVYIAIGLVRKRE
jgi:hypothetical protein